MMVTRAKKEKLNRLNLFGLRLGCVFIVVGMSLCSACAAKLLKTQKVHFRCDSDFNGGLILPVDLVFVPEGKKVSTITGVSPDEWFDSDERENWSSKQSMSFMASNVRRTVKVKLKKPGRTVALVIVADYKNVEATKSQMIVLDASAEENEDIFITISGLLH